MQSTVFVSIYFTFHLSPSTVSIPSPAVWLNILSATPCVFSPLVIASIFVYKNFGKKSNLSLLKPNTPITANRIQHKNNNTFLNFCYISHHNRKCPKKEINKPTTTDMINNGKTQREFPLPEAIINGKDRARETTMPFHHH